MAKCIRCGKSTLVRGHVKISDADLCTPCYKALGFKTGLADLTIARSYKWDEIKDGYEEYLNRQNRASWERYYSEEADKFGLSVEQIKALDKINATDMEKKILGAIDAVLFDEDCDAHRLCPALGHNDSVLLMLDGVVAIEYKADSGVKWIRFPNESEEKIKIGGAARINSLGVRVADAYRSAVE